MRFFIGLILMMLCGSAQAATPPYTCTDLINAIHKNDNKSLLDIANNMSGYLQLYWPQIVTNDSDIDQISLGTGHECALAVATGYGDIQVLTVLRNLAIQITDTE